MSDRRYIIKRDKDVDKQFKLVPATWYEAIAVEILKGIYQRTPQMFTFYKSKYACLEEDVLKGLEELSKLDRQFPVRVEFIKHYYGYYDNHFYSREEICQKLELEKVNNMSALAWNDIPASCYPISHYYDYTGQHYKSIDLKEVLYREIMAMLDGKKEEVTFLTQIMDRYDISVSCKGNAPKKDLVGLGISVRLYNCLYLAGITTSTQLRLMSESDLQGIPRLGRRGMEELLKIREKILYRDSEPFVVKIYHHNQESTYTFKDAPELEINKQLFDIVVNEVLHSQGDTLFDYPLSTGLENFLLIKGYLIMSDIAENSELLQKELRYINLSGYATELESLTKAVSEYKKQKEDSQIDVMIVSDYVLDEIINGSCERHCPISRIRLLLEERIKTIRDVFRNGESYIAQLRNYDFVLLDAEIPYTVNVDGNGFLIYELNYEEASGEEKKKLAELPIKLPLNTHIPKEIQYLDYDNEDILKRMLEEMANDLYTLSAFFGDDDSILVAIDELRDEIWETEEDSV